MAEMMWDQSLSPDELISEFLVGYYSSAGAPFVRLYMETMHAAVNSSGYFLDSECMGPPEGVHKPYLTPVALLESATAFAKGLTATASGPEKYRVRLARASMANLYTILWRWVELRSFATNISMHWPLPATQEAGFEKFATLFNASGTKLLTNNGLGPAARSGSGPVALEWLHRNIFRNMSDLPTVHLKTDDSQNSATPPHSLVTSPAITLDCGTSAHRPVKDAAEVACNMAIAASVEGQVKWIRIDRTDSPDWDTGSSGNFPLWVKRSWGLAGIVLSFKGQVGDNPMIRGHAIDKGSFGLVASGWDSRWNSSRLTSNSSAEILHYDWAGFRAQRFRVDIEPPTGNPNAVTLRGVAINSSLPSATHWTFWPFWPVSTNGTGPAVFEPHNVNDMLQATGA
jgi:hypothetical protein